MGFFVWIKNSVYSPDFYKSIPNLSLGNVIGYFLVLSLLLSIISTLLAGYDLGVRAPQEIKNSISETVNSYPADLEVNIENGQVSTNTEEPVFIAFPQDSSEISREKVNNILVIDTKTPFSASQFDQYKTVMWLTRDSLFYRNGTYEQRSVDLSKVKDFKVNREVINGYVEKINPYFKFLGPGLLFIAFIFSLIYYASNLIYFLFLATLIFFLASIFKWGLNYKNSYKCAVIASTLAFFIELILTETARFSGFDGFPFMFSLIALCVATINYQALERK